MVRWNFGEPVLVRPSVGRRPGVGPIRNNCRDDRGGQLIRARVCRTTKMGFGYSTGAKYRRRAVIETNKWLYTRAARVFVIFPAADGGWVRRPRTRTRVTCSLPRGNGFLATCFREHVGPDVLGRARGRKNTVNVSPINRSRSRCAAAHRQPYMANGATKAEATNVPDGARTTLRDRFFVLFVYFGVAGRAIRLLSGFVSVSVSFRNISNIRRTACVRCWPPPPAIERYHYRRFGRTSSGLVSKMGSAVRNVICVARNGRAVFRVQNTRQHSPRGRLPTRITVPRVDSSFVSEKSSETTDDVCSRTFFSAFWSWTRRIIRVAGDDAVGYFFLYVIWNGQPVSADLTNSISLVPPIASLRRLVLYVPVFTTVYFTNAPRIFDL